jgi:hypothetical protein
MAVPAIADSALFQSYRRVNSRTAPPKMSIQMRVRSQTEP